MQPDSPPGRRFQRKDVDPLAVLRAAANRQWPLHVQLLPIPPKVVYRKLEQMNAAGLLECGINDAYSWPTPMGYEILRADERERERHARAHAQRSEAAARMRAQIRPVCVHCQGFASDGEHGIGTCVPAPPPPPPPVHGPRPGPPIVLDGCPVHVWHRLLEMVDDADGMDAFMEYIGLGADRWPEWVAPYR